MGNISPQGKQKKSSLASQENEKQANNDLREALVELRKEEEEKWFSWEKDPDVAQDLDFDMWYPIVKDHTPISNLVRPPTKKAAPLFFAAPHSKTTKSLFYRRMKSVQ